MHHIVIPTPPGSPAISIHVEPGKPVVFVGPNGAGKSALSTYISSVVPYESVNRIIAHRKLWMNSSGAEVTHSQKESYASNFIHWDQSPDSRWRDHGEAVRGSFILLDLLGIQSGKNQELVDKARSGQSIQNEKSYGPLDEVNKIFGSAGLDIALSMKNSGELEAVTKDGYRYPAAQMSDGEKSALFLVADVLVADQGSIHVIDEPERHIHSSISPRLVTALVSSRPKDSFIIFTHDLELAQHLGRIGSTYMVSKCEWQADNPGPWTVHAVDGSNSLPDELKSAVLGGRAKILFHEGSLGGLDSRLYEALMPGYTCVAAGSCSHVIKGVVGLRGSQEHHWLNAIGFVDRDFEKRSLPSGVTAIDFHEIENVFFDPLITGHMAGLYAELSGVAVEGVKKRVEEEFISSMSDSNVRNRSILQCGIARVRDDLQDQVNVIKSIDALGGVTIRSEFNFTEAQDRYDKLLASDISRFLREFPIRESGARRAVARVLGFSGPDEYEFAVLNQIRLDPVLAATLRGEIGLPDPS